MQSDISKLLHVLDIRPVLMDIGASGSPPPIWNDIASESIYIGLDPDLREIHEDRSSQFHRSVIINEAVTAEKDVTEAIFYLTRSPFCSTVLEPNPAATAACRRATCSGNCHVRATTIDSIQAPEYSQHRLDEARRRARIPADQQPASGGSLKVMAIDTEPGLIDIYQREDMFVDVHRDLTSSGFWLSGMYTGGFVRMRRRTLEAAREVNAKIDDQYIRSSIRSSPAYLEARYLRTLEWLAEKSMSMREYTVLWIFALTDNQLGFALDLGVEFDRIFGATDASRQLNAETWRLINKARRRYAISRASGPITRRLRSVLGKFL